MDFYSFELWGRLTVPQLRAELENQGGRIATRSRKEIYVTSLISLLRTNEQHLRPFLADTQILLTQTGVQAPVPPPVRPEVATAVAQAIAAAPTPHERGQIRRRENAARAQQAILDTATRLQTRALEIEAERAAMGRQRVASPDAIRQLLAAFNSPGRGARARLPDHDPEEAETTAALRQLAGFTDRPRPVATRSPTRLEAQRAVETQRAQGVVARARATLERTAEATARLEAERQTATARPRPAALTRPTAAATQPRARALSNELQEALRTLPYVPPTPNPYTLMSQAIRTSIATERDIDATTAAALQQVDEILPDWVEGATLARATTMTSGQAFYVAARRGINFNNITGTNMPTTIEALLIMIALWPTCRAPRTDLAPRPYVEEDITVTIPEAFEMAAQGIKPTRVTGTTTLELQTITRPQFYEYPPLITRQQYMFLMITPRPQLLQLPVQAWGLDAAELEFYSDNELRFLLSRCAYPPTTADRQLYMERAQRIRAADAEIRAVILAYHNTESIPVYARMAADPLDELIYGVATYPIPQLAAQVGMIIPSNVMDARAYYLANVRSYFPIFQRDPTQFQPLTLALARRARRIEEFLALYTDEEIIRGLGGYVNYQGRAHLLQQYRDLLTNGEMFFIPFERACANEYTQLGTATADPTNFVVAFGNFNNYTCYDPDEFLMTFTRREDPETGIPGDFAFARPDNTRAVFSRPQVIQLAALGPLFPEQLRDVQQRIAEGITLVEMQGQVTDKARKMFQRIGEPYRDQIRQILLQLFYTGMYMRRWGGPGCAYPLAKRDTENRPDPDVPVSAGLARLREMLAALPAPVSAFLLALPMLEYTGNGTYHREGQNLAYYINEVWEGRYCIRMGSSKFVTTAYAYLMNFLGETIADFDIRELARVF